MAKKLDVIGNRYSHWTVIAETEPKEYFSKARNKKCYQRRVICQCDCENKTIRTLTLALLRSGSCKSCGCARSEYISKARKKPFNYYEIEGDYAKIYLDDMSDYTIVDADNLDKLKFSHIGKEKDSGYWYLSDGKRIRMRLHRFLFGAYYDHKNLNKSDNRRENMRKCTPRQNNINIAPNKRNKIGLKGVSKTDEKYSAFCRIKGRSVYLGRWDTPEEAAHAYDIAAYQEHGEFAYLNYPEDIDCENKNIENQVNYQIDKYKNRWLKGDAD